MDLILIMVTLIAPFAIGELLQGEKIVIKKKNMNYSEMIKKGYKVCKYGNFDYAYKRI